MEVLFAGLTIHSGYVGLYFMPIYSDSGLKEMFGPELLRTFKGKSCFHIKELDPVIEGQIREALRKGFVLYREKEGV